MGLALLFGTEHAVSLVISFSLVSAAAVVVAPASLRKENMAFVFYAGLAAVASSMLAFITLVGWDGMQAALRYALVELPADKFWYDGAPPNPYLGTWSDLVTSRHFVLPLVPFVAAAILLMSLTRKFFASSFRLQSNWEMVAVWMLLYGILSGVALLGVFSKHYVFPIVRVLILTTILLAAHGWPHWLWRQGLERRISPLKVPVAIACACASILLIGLSATSSLELYRHYTADKFEYSRALSHRWDTFMMRATRLLESHRHGRSVSLWSVYSGLLDAHYSVFVPGEDYITLSVGPNRPVRYVQSFESHQPEFVQTMSSSFAYEEWLENVKWPFYEQLFNNYDLLGSVDHASFWQRRSAAWVAPSSSFQPTVLDTAAAVAEIHPKEAGPFLGVVRLRYSVENPWKIVPLLGQSPRFMIFLAGTERNTPLAVPPYLTQVDFPVAFSASRGIQMKFVTRSLLPGAKFHPQQVEWKRLPLPSGTAAAVLPYHSPVAHLRN